MRRLLFAVAILYTILVITRPQEFVPALEGMPLLQVILLAGMGIWALTPDKGLDLAQFTVLPLFLFGVFLSLGFAGWWGGIIPALDKLLPPIFLFVILSGCIRSVRELKIYSFVVIACACVLVLHGHIQKTTGIGWTGQPMIEGRITYSGMFNDPNDLGLLIVLSISLTMFQLRARRGKLIRLVMLSAIFWLLYGVYLTDSRGTMLAVMAVMGLELWRKFGKTVVIVAGLMAVPLLFAFTRLSELNAEEASAGNRVDAWYEGVQMLIDNPVFGVGWNMFGDVHYMTAHNSIVLAMAELGLFGFLWWFLLVFVTGAMIIRLVNLGPELLPVSHHAGAAPAATESPPASPGTVAKPGPKASWRQARLASMGRTGDRSGAAHSRGRAGDSLNDPGAESEQAIPARDMELWAAWSLLLGAVGFAIGAFFLSQSYKVMLFINCGLIVGRYMGMKEAGFPVPEYRLANWIPVSFGAAMATIVGLWILVKILL